MPEAASIGSNEVLSESSQPENSKRIRVIVHDQRNRFSFGERCQRRGVANSGVWCQTVGTALRVLGVELLTREITAMGVDGAGRDAERARGSRRTGEL